MTDIQQGLDLVRLGAWMDAHGLGSGFIGDVRPLAGGTQNILLTFRRGEGEYVLRRPPMALRPESNEIMRREARILGALAATPVPHPRLLAACGDEGVLGYAFYVMERVDGFNVTVGLPALHRQSRELRRRMGLALVEGAAALGSVDHVRVGLEDFGKPEGYLARQVERWRAELTRYASFQGWPGAHRLPGLAQVIEYLTANQPETFPPGIMHGDFHIANVLFRHDTAELAAIVDWELATIGDPCSTSVGYLPRGGRTMGSI